MLSCDTSSLRRLVTTFSSEKSVSLPYKSVPLCQTPQSQRHYKENNSNMVNSIFFTSQTESVMSKGDFLEIVMTALRPC